MITLPGVLFLLAVLFTTDIIFTHKVDLNFIREKVGLIKIILEKLAAQDGFLINMNRTNFFL